MNHRVVSEKEKRETRRRRNRRRHLRKQKNRRERLLQSVLAPSALPVIDAGLVTPEEAFAILFGPLKSARRMLRRLQAAQNALNHEVTPIQFGGGNLQPPRRELRAASRGLPTDAGMFWTQFAAGLRAAAMLRHRGAIGYDTEGTAFLSPTGLRELLPGISVPLRFEREVYLAQVAPARGHEASRLDVYSAMLTPLFSVPLPFRWNDLAHEAENASAGAEG